MKRLGYVALVVALTAGGVFAQSKSSTKLDTKTSQTEVNQTDVKTNLPPASSESKDLGTKDLSTKDLNINKTDSSLPASSTNVKTDVDINKTETTNPMPSSSSSSSSTSFGMDGKTVLIGGALLLGIILIAVAAAGRDETTAVR